jgi:uncharacterized protein (TIGR03435 family)
VSQEGVRFVASNASLKSVLLFAYVAPSGRPLRIVDIFGSPAWADSDRFDMQGTVAVSVPPTGEQMRSMVQSLLIERFQLKAHWETRDMPTYNLVIAKNGPKMKPVSVPATGVRQIGKPGPAGISLTLSANALPVEGLVNILQTYARRPLIDKTGLSGMFELNLEFFMEATVTDAGAAAASPMGPDFSTAIEEQLGLKLESARGPVEVLVIDRVEKPSEN